jgi:hypothetical protein
MVNPKSCSAAFVVLALLLFARPASAIVLGQLDTFQDGTTNEWTNGGLATPVTNISSGGPAGAGDRYIRLTADGSGAGGRLTTFNFTTWAGDFISAGVTTLEIDLLNQSAVNLSIRFAFEVDVVQNAPGYLTAPMLLPVGSGWQHFSISITAANLIPVNSPAPYNTFFSNIMETRIIHEVGTNDLNGDPIVGQLGIDNIHAVPEPTATALAATGLLALTARFLRAKRRAIR